MFHNATFEAYLLQLETSRYLVSQLLLNTVLFNVIRKQKYTRDVAVIKKDTRDCYLHNMSDRVCKNSKKPIQKLLEQIGEI